jgi:hypothetical protein
MKEFFRKAGSFGTWRSIVNFWSFVFYVAIVYDFLHENALSDNEIMLGIASIYCAVLAIYSAEKEFRRWHNMHDGIHPGELYLVTWTVLIVGIIASAIIFQLPYHMPVEVSASYIAVITILAITRESKNFYKRKNKK